jgi:hypothetical protein
MPSTVLSAYYLLVGMLATAVVVGLALALLADRGGR